MKALREPFPPDMVGRLPKGGVELDYVGHGAVTSRLLEVDPEWSWEPLSVDDHGFPRLDAQGNLWIKLTVGGVTRLGVGDGPNMKVLIGDALRNAAMRFGVALDLWIRGHAEDDEQQPQQQSQRSKPAQLAPALADLIADIDSFPEPNRSALVAEIYQQVWNGQEAPLEKLPENWWPHLRKLVDKRTSESAEASTGPSGPQGGEGASNPPVDPPAPPAAPAGTDNTTTPAGAAAVTRPASNSPVAAARAALKGDKKALGALKQEPVDDQPCGLEGFVEAFPGSEEVA